MRANSKTNLAIAILFTVSIFLPFMLLAFQGLNTNSNIQEKRTLAAVPSFNLKDVSSYPGQFEDFFNDHFGLRDRLINLNNLIRINVFNSSGSPKVLVGKEGWLFLKGAQAKEGNTISNHLGLMPFGYKEIFRDFKNNLEQKRNYLEKLGIRYLFVIAPSKWTVYPEYLPEGFENPDRKSSIDLLVEYLRNNTDVEIIDLRKTITQAKRLGKPLFYKKDTHWNTMGAFFGYLEIAKKASLYFPNIKPRSINDFNLVQKIMLKSTDLGNMLSIKKSPETRYNFIPKSPYSYSIKTTADDKRGTKIFKRNGANLPKALFFRDSFFESLIPFMSDNFSLSVYVFSDYANVTDIDEIKPWLTKYNPDIVIEEKVERYLLPGIGLDVF